MRQLVGEAMSVIADNSDVPVSVKCRIGVDDRDSYNELCKFLLHCLGTIIISFWIFFFLSGITKPIFVERKSIFRIPIDLAYNPPANQLRTQKQQC